MATITERDLAATIDHAILKPELTRADVDAELDIAAEWRVFSVCVRPSDIAHAVARLDGTGVAVGTVIGFPHGTTSTAAKVAEVRQALADGATEFDMVVNIGALRSGFDDVVTADIAAVVAAASGHVTKVILETSLLDDEQIARGSRLTEAGGADFVKTSTGFAGGGATVPHVEAACGRTWVQACRSRLPAGCAATPTPWRCSRPARRAWAPAAAPSSSARRGAWMPAATPSAPWTPPRTDPGQVSTARTRATSSVICAMSASMPSKATMPRMRCANWICTR